MSAYAVILPYLLILFCNLSSIGILWSLNLPAEIHNKWNRRILWAVMLSITLTLLIQQGMFLYGV